MEETVQNAHLDALLESPPQGVAEMDGDDLRSLRAELQEAESGVSYLRRIVQGRLDLVLAELDGRRDAAAGDPPAESEGTEQAEVVSKIAEALGQHGRGSGFPRPPLELQPPAFAAEMMIQIDESCPLSVGQLAEADEKSLASLADCLAKMERKLTADRHTLHGYIDVAQAEIISRYRSGALSVDSLLGS